MSSSSGPVSHSESIQEEELQRVRWDIIADKEVQQNVADTIREAFDKAGFRIAYQEKEGVHVLVQIKGRIPRSR